MKKYTILNNTKHLVCNYEFTTTIQQFRLQSPACKK
jgi:hypothetical protein